MKRTLYKVLTIVLWVSGLAAAQVPALIASGPAAETLPLYAFPSDGSLSTANGNAGALPALESPIALPRMAPELALQTYERQAARQAAALASYSSTTLIRAELPDSAQSGEYELQRHYSAPHSLQFKAVQFTGDGFVKSNIITRLLQSEVDHVQKDEVSLTAISSANYKFSYKGTSQVEGRAVHVYQVKPREKRAGLFKGRVYLDAFTGSLVRVEGSVVKSPSFFIKKIEFVQDYADIGSFTFPMHIHSEARARLVGRAVVDIYQSDYQPVANTTEVTQQIPTK